MDIALFARGLVLGFAIAAAVGPISLLTIRRTLTDGLRIGLASGAGVATADAAYAGVAAFGLTAISELLVGQARVLGLVGDAFLVYLGLRTLLSRPTASTSTAAATPPAAASVSAAPSNAAVPTSAAAATSSTDTSAPSRGIAAAYLSILGLTLANPMTILSFAALFVGLGVIEQGGLGAAVLVAGVFLGSMAWWVVLTFTVSRLRMRVTPAALRWITVASGVLIATFGLAAIVGVLR